jgi:hypothetical protein
MTAAAAPLLAQHTRSFLLDWFDLAELTDAGRPESDAVLWNTPDNGSVVGP